MSVKAGMGVAMRGDDAILGKLFRYTDREKRVRRGHPLRAIRMIANAALKSLSGEGTTAPISAWRLRERAVTPHLAQNHSGRRSAIERAQDPRPRLCDLAAHPQPYRGSLRLGKTASGLRKMRHRGLPKSIGNSPWQPAILSDQPELLAEAAL
jgi:hypothetical protein